MTSSTTGQPPTRVDIPPLHKPCFVDLLKPPPSITKFVPMKPVEFLHGEPHIVWEKEEINQMIINKNLQFVVIDKFSYAGRDFQDLKRRIPKQCDLKGECNIGVLNNKHILTRASNMEDYVHILSKPVFYITHKHWTYTMRTLK